jgi:hypothetical protein
MLVGDVVAQTGMYICMWCVRRGLGVGRDTGIAGKKEAEGKEAAGGSGHGGV